MALSKGKVAIIVAVISAAAVVISVLLEKLPSKVSVPEGIEYAGRIVDAQTNRPIPDAKVSLEFKGVPPVIYTDEEGIYNFQLTQPPTGSVRVRVEASGYDPYTRRIQWQEFSELEDIRLTSVRADPPTPKAQNDLPPAKFPSKPPVAALGNSLKAKLENYLVELAKIERNWKKEHANVVPLAERVEAVLRTRYPESAEKIMTATSLSKSEDVAAVVRIEIQKVLEQIDVERQE